MQLDAERLRDLQIFDRNELQAIGRRVIDAISHELDAAEFALAGQDYEAAGEAAHRARNETLLIGARELADVLGSVEAAARAGGKSVAAEAVSAARALWPPTRDAIARATQCATG